MTGYVYFIGNGSVVKIGVAMNPRQRLNDLQIGNHERLALLHTIKTNDTRKLEKWLHQKYAARRLSGEWFALSGGELQEVLAMGDVIYDETPAPAIEQRQTDGTIDRPSDVPQGARLYKKKHRHQVYNVWRWFDELGKRRMKYAGRNNG